MAEVLSGKSVKKITVSNNGAKYYSDLTKQYRDEVVETVTRAESIIEDTQEFYDEANEFLEAIKQTTQNEFNEIAANAQETITEAVTNAETRISTAVTEAEATINSAVSDAEDTIDTKVSAAQSTISTAASTAESTINSAVTNAETRIDTKIATAESTIDDITEDITTIQGQISTIEEQIETIESDVELAHDWAVKTDGMVDNEDYSSKYYASQAGTSASNASQSATNALTSATSAATSATNAATSETNAATSEANAKESEELAEEYARQCIEESVIDGSVTMAKLANDVKAAFADINFSNISQTALEVIANNGGVPPQPVSNAKVYVDDGDFKLMWNDPADISVTGYSFYEWTKTVIVAKAGSYPESPTDGIVILTETTKNSYSSSAYTWTPQQYDDYYFRAFAYSQKNIYNKDNDNKFAGLAPEVITNPKSHKTSTGYELTWTDPADTNLLSWACTYIIRKEGSYPTSITDGTQVLKSLVRNQYSSNPYTDIVPDATLNYYYRAFTYSSNNLYNTSENNKFSELAPLTATSCFCDNVTNNYPELIWVDPDNYSMCSWVKTVIVRKVGSAPASVSDGTIVYTETVKNSHTDNTCSYVDTTALTGVDYHYKAFPCSTNGIYNTNSDEFTFKAIYITKYQYGIDTTESSSASIIRYIGGNYTPISINFSTGTASMGSFDESFLIPTPVMLKNDVVDYELNPNNFTLKKNGGASDVSNSSYGGDCMLQFPQIWRKYYLDPDNGSIQRIDLANEKIDNDYQCWTHYNKNGVLVPYIYLQAFEPCLINNKLYSLADQTILKSTSGETMKTYAQNKGNGWGFMTFDQIRMLQAILMFLSKSTDSQTTLGGGVVGGTEMTTSGTTKDKPMFYATSNSTSSNAAIKVLGMENMWGNHFKWIDGLVIPKLSSSSANRVVKYKLTESTADGTSVTGYNQDGSGYKTLASNSSDLNGYLSQMMLNSDGLFPSPTNLSGSSSTYFADKCYFYGSTSYDYFARFGGVYAYGGNAGLFCVHVGNQLAYSGSYSGASLSFVPLS